jgi:hypothetical protein
VNASGVTIADPVTAKRMVMLLVRGRKHYARWMDKLPVRDRPIGLSSTSIVTRFDFIKHVELCLIHVLCNTPTLYILCEENGTLCAVLSKKDPHHE